MDTVKLTIEQYQKLVQRRDQLKEEENIKDFDFINFDTRGSTGFEDTADYHSIATSNGAKIERKQIDAMLKNCEIIEATSNDRVGLGTTCSVVLDFGDGELYCSDYKLVAENHGTVSTEDNAIYVTPNSEFGKAIMGKGLMDGIYYTLPNGLEVFGFIEDIEESKQKVR